MCIWVINRIISVSCCTDQGEKASTANTAFTASVKDHFINVLFLGTHPDDDSGAPHAIEHLVFRGSKRFPQKVNFNRPLKQSTVTTDIYVFPSMVVVGQAHFIVLRLRQHRARVEKYFRLYFGPRVNKKQMLIDITFSVLQMMDSWYD